MMLIHIQAEWGKGAVFIFISKRSMFNNVWMELARFQVLIIRRSLAAFESCQSTGTILHSLPIAICWTVHAGYKFEYCQLCWPGKTGLSLICIHLVVTEQGLGVLGRISFSPMVNHSTSVHMHNNYLPFFHSSQWNQRWIHGSRGEISLGKSIKRDRCGFIYKLTAFYLNTPHNIHVNFVIVAITV